MTSRATAFPKLPSTISERTVPDLLRRAAEDAPDRCALVAHSVLSGEEASLSYQELAERSGRFAAVLADRGVTHGDRVALLVGNDGALEAHLAYHAVHRLGAINVPVNTFYLERELEYVVGFSQPKALVFGPSFAETLSGCTWAADAPALLELSATAQAGESLPQLIEASTRATPDVVAREGDEADWIFTSGTTGHPKAVALTHAQSVACGHEARDVWGLESSSVYQNSSPFFTSTGCRTNLLSCLAAGCTFVVDPEVDAQAILDRAVRRGTTSMFVLTAILAILLRRLDDGRVRSLEVPTLRRLFYGGQTMPRAFHERLEDEFATRQGVQLGVVYGLTEGGTSGVMLDPVDHADAVRRHGPYGLSIGRRGWNEWVHHRIVGEDGGDVAPGEVGEIWLRAPSVMERYVSNEAATEAALADGWLHTGDMATVDDDGFMFFVDRSKSMIRRGGMNIAAAEVEAVAMAHPAVAEAAAMGRPNPLLGEDVHLVAVLRTGEALTAADLIEFCGKRLAAYKTPRDVTFVDALPHNAMGKVSRAELGSLVATEQPFLS
jgi:acyl-CoA synthetase (AMP-forming)/AMP-acid ligase II